MVLNMVLPLAPKKMTYSLAEDISEQVDKGEICQNDFCSKSRIKNVLRDLHLILLKI